MSRKEECEHKRDDGEDGADRERSTCTSCDRGRIGPSGGGTEYSDEDCQTGGAAELLDGIERGAAVTGEIARE